MRGERISEIRAEGSGTPGALRAPRSPSRYSASTSLIGQVHRGEVLEESHPGLVLCSISSTSSFSGMGRFCVVSFTFCLLLHRSRRIRNRISSYC
ncbi:MAG: hypothetical protein DMF49_08620 [Acidobacteria bacterium]|nr:MAG: hypothetical protein DMF49_08620 [Acidobacteriota bacterium]